MNDLKRRLLFRQLRKLYRDNIGAFQFLKARQSLRHLAQLVLRKKP